MALSDHNPPKPYVYQPFGPVSHPQYEGRLYGIGHPDWRVTIKGLTKAEADVVLDALLRLTAREELTRIGQEIGGYDVNSGFEPGTR